MLASPATSFTMRDVYESFDEGTFAKGLSYYKKGLVQGYYIKEKQFIYSKVKGSYQPYYDVIISCEAEEDEVFFSGSCSCPVGDDCKHIVATLLAVQNDQKNAAVKKERAEKDYSLEAWSVFLKELNSPKPIQKNFVPQKLNMELVYILNRKILHHQQSLQVSLHLVYLLKKGGFGNMRKFSPGRNSYRDYIKPEDDDILHHLAVLQRKNEWAYYDDEHVCSLKGNMAFDILSLIVKTGRCYWQDLKSSPLRLGDPLNANFNWELEEGGTQKLVCKAEVEAELMYDSLPIYVNHQQSIIGKIEFDVAEDIAYRLMRMPPIATQKAKQLHDAIKTSAPQLPLPRSFSTIITEKAKLTTRLSLYNKEAASINIPMAKLHFDYDNAQLNETTQDAIEYVEDDKLMRIMRDKKAEEQAVLRLQKMGLEATMDASSIFYVGNPGNKQGQLSFIFEGVPQLKKEKWEVDVSEDFSLSCIEDTEWFTEVEEKTEYDWFGMTFGITHQGEKINLVPFIADFIKTLPQDNIQKIIENYPDEHLFYIPLSGEKHVAISAKRIKNILAILVEMYDAGSGEELRISRMQAGHLLALQETLNATWLGSDRLKTLAEKLRNFKKIKNQPLPKGLKGKLRPYQKQGYNWLKFLSDLGFGGILADDMGLGKTIQILTFLLSEKAAGQTNPTLIVAPTSLMENWRKEGQRFAPSLTMLILQGEARKESFTDIASYDVVVTTYPLLHRDREELIAQSFHYLILDEAQYVKNPRTVSYEVLLEIKRTQTLCVTGTPMENHLGELWSLFNVATPGLLGSEMRFNKLFRNPIEKDKDLSKQKILAGRIAPFMLRRNKEEVVKELPPKTEIIHRIEMEGPQRDLYESIRLTMEEKVRKAIQSKGLSRSHIVILDALLKLRQICNDPSLLKLKTSKKVKHSHKLAFLLEMVATLIAENKRILLFSSFTSMLTIIEEAFGKAGYSTVKLTGQTKDRITPVERFQNNEVQIMLVSLKAGGTGLNLTAADTVIHYDPWWNPAAESQATDRAHRIGQDKPVFVYKLVCKETVEEKIIEMQQNKKRLIDNLFEAQEKGIAKLSKEDLEHLFASAL
jgi:hypothetical protein